MTTGSRTEGVRGIGSNGFIRTVGNLTVTGDLVVLGENRALAGTGSFFWEDADANAEYWAFELPTGTSEHVPVLGVGVGLDGVDLGLFDGITQPTLAVIDADRDAFIAMDFSGDDAARLRANAAMTISTSTGDLTLDPAGNDVILLDGTSLALGTDADSKLAWEVADANAEYLAFALPAGTSTVVPVIGVGIGLASVDLGLFNGITFPTVAVLDADRDSFIAIDHSADDAARLRSNTPLTIESGGAFYLRTTAGEDINLVYGGAWRVRDKDDGEAVRLTINSATGEVIFSSTSTGTISTAAGDLTLDPAASLNVTLTDGDGDAFDLNVGGASYYVIDTYPGSGRPAHTFDRPNFSLASASASTWGLVKMGPFTWTMTSGTSVTTPIDGLALHIAAPAIQSSSTTAIAQVSSLYVAAPDVSDSDVTATINLAAEIDGPLLLTSSIWAEGTATEGSSGEQLESAGAGAVVIWAAAGSQAAVKDIEGYLEPQEALDALTGVAVPRWHYRRERADGSRAATTGDYVTEYVGVLAEDFPQVMHHEGRIFSPVSAFGYTVGAIQAIEARLRRMEEQAWQ